MLIIARLIRKQTNSVEEIALSSDCGKKLRLLDLLQIGDKVNCFCSVHLDEIKYLDICFLRHVEKALVRMGG